MATDSANENDRLAALYLGNLIPLYVVREYLLLAKTLRSADCVTRTVVGLTWIVHDYGKRSFFLLPYTIRYIWPQRRNIGKILFLWIRYYSISLLVFDALQIHVFSIRGVPSDRLCVAVDAITRITGAISLWSVEIVMQLRVYALFKCSKKVAVINGFLFASSIAAFLWILIHNVGIQGAVIADAVRLPLAGCPSIHSGIEWAQWVPATAYEIVLFSFAIVKTFGFMLDNMTRGYRQSLRSILLRDNILYFLAISCVLVLNNLMVVGATEIPWFSFGPFHAAVGVLTTRMLINLRKAASQEISTLHFPQTHATCQETNPIGQLGSLSSLIFETPIDPFMTEIGEPDVLTELNSISEERRTNE
ncbi:hypothetical protein IW261DRAFT_1338928 [Armillaria novae-zelandiae]|uniref:Uncharacterized protein n=1 Tax=Armillaria novae-zelandiae TaxID=153914 RepID=A0AA39P3S7_9AGAR|nr:hypothetical protein IW261DRAFT_1338928 [Armillaria novae-zelandiae]